MHRSSQQRKTILRELGMFYQSQKRWLWTKAIIVTAMIALTIVVHQ